MSVTCERGLVRSFIYAVFQNIGWNTFAVQAAESIYCCEEESESLNRMQRDSRKIVWKLKLLCVYEIG